MTQSVALEPREKATGRNREDRVVEKKTMERVGRESLIDFFEHLIGETKETKDGKEIAKEGQRDEAERARRKESLRFLPSLSCAVAFGEVFGVPYLCCHGNSLDSREELEKTQSRWIAQREGEEKRA